MNKFFEWITRHPILVIAITILLTALSAFQAKDIKIIIDTAKMMPQSNPYVAASTEIEKIFKSKHVVVVGITPKSGDIYQSDILKKVQRLTAEFQNVPGVVKDNILSLSARRAKDISGTDDGLVVTPLMETVPSTTDEMARLKRSIEQNPIYIGSIVAADHRSTAILLEFKDEPKGFRTIMDKVEPIVAKERDASVDIQLGGLPHFLSKVETYSERMGIFLPISFVILCVILFFAFRTIQGMVLPLITALMAVAWGVGIMGAAGVPMDVFNATTPILILAVATGHAVQMLKRYYEEYERFRIDDTLTPVEANRRAVVASLTHLAPVMLSAGTVATLGFFSLTVFEISTVRTFGIFTGIGILATMLLEMTFIPALRSVLRPPAPKARTKTAWHGLISGLTHLVTQRRPVVYLCAAALVVVAIAGTSKVVEDNSVKKYFASSESFQQDDHALNKNLGGTNTVYLLIQGNEPDAIKDPAVLKAMDQMQEFLDQEPGVGKTMSLVDLLKRMNQAMHGDDPRQYAIPDSKDLVSQYLLLYSMSGEPGDFDSYVDYDYRQAKLTALIKTDSTAYAEHLIDKIKLKAKALFPSDVHVSIGGSAPQDTALNQTMVEDKLLNIAQIAGVVFIVSALIFRSLLAGALVLLPLLITVLVNFGIMGWGGILLNIPTSLTSAMAVGIGADYAIYLLFRIREELARQPDETLAVKKVMHTAGEAILFVATAVAAGYGVLLLSKGFYIHMWLATLIGTAMLVSALTALTLIPAIILSIKPRFLKGTAFSDTRQAATSLTALVLCVGFWASHQDSHAADSPDVTKLMSQTNDVSKVTDSSMQATFKLINSSGQERVRKVMGLTKLESNGRDNMRITRFVSPPDVKGTTSLLKENASADDDMWIYLPALKKTRRLVSSNKKDSFVGTDFSYADVIGYRVSEWRYKLVGEETLDGQSCWVIEASPKNEQVALDTGLSKRLNWLRKDNAFTVRVEYWDSQGQKQKIATYKDVRQVDSHQNKWQAMQMEAQNLQTGHRTTITFDQFNANVGIQNEVFSVASLERQ